MCICIMQIACRAKKGRVLYADVSEAIANLARDVDLCCTGSVSEECIISDEVCYIKPSANEFSLCTDIHVQNL